MRHTQLSCSRAVYNHFHLCECNSTRYGCEDKFKYSLHKLLMGGGVNQVYLSVGKKIYEGGIKSEFMEGIKYQ